MVPQEIWFCWDSANWDGRVRDTVAIWVSWKNLSEKEWKPMMVIEIDRKWSMTMTGYYKAFPVLSDWLREWILEWGRFKESITVVISGDIIKRHRDIRRKTKLICWVFSFVLFGLLWCLLSKILMSIWDLTLTELSWLTLKTFTVKRL